MHLQLRDSLKRYTLIMFIVFSAYQINLVCGEKELFNDYLLLFCLVIFTITYNVCTAMRQCRLVWIRTLVLILFIRGNNMPINICNSHRELTIILKGVAYAKSVPWDFYSRVNQQVQNYNTRLKNSCFGVEKFNFSLGLSFNFFCIEIILLSV